MQDKQVQNWSSLEKEWDVIIIGGGITGAGIFRMASTCGLRTLLVEARDFSFGTSSRSSKMIHGGIRYLRNLQIKIAYESVRERERILKEAINLVTPLEFIFPIYQKYHYTSTQVGIYLGIYDFFGMKNTHGRITISDLDQLTPRLRRNNLSFAYYYYDALVDDSRLVFRNIQEGIDLGGTALNYVRVYDLIRNHDGLVKGIVIKHNENHTEDKLQELYAKVIVNATGPWSDELRSKITNDRIIRKLRGSHLLFSSKRFPIEHAFSLVHPIDNRALFVLPWESVTVIGTTDLDHPADYERDYAEPFMTYLEEEYLLIAANHFFPSLQLTSKDIVSSFSGLRPIVSSNKTKPSKASRAHVVLEDHGLITITGGKMTTYRQMAYEVMQKIQQRIILPKRLDRKNNILHENIEIDKNKYSNELFHRWQGRFGESLPDFIASIRQDEQILIPETQTSWAEIRWAARNEHIVHLDDLLLRRVRLGIHLPKGGMQYEERIRKIIMEECGWNDEKWNAESVRYKEIITRYYSKST